MLERMLIHLLFPILTFVIFIGANVAENDQSEQRFAVFGYLPEYRLNNFDYDGAFENGLTHLIYFSLEIDDRTGLPSALDRLPPKSEVQRARIAADKVGGKLLLGFGGNARSGGFGAMTSARKIRVKFLHAVDALLREYQLDGVDYNWEYPRSYVEWKNWGLLMKESKALLLDGKLNNVVTFTMYLDPNHFNTIEQYKLLEHADYLHCMAYDSRGKHSTHEFAQQGIDLAEKILRKGKTKWTLGVPFYGRDIYNGEPKAYYDILPMIKGRKSTGDVIGSLFYNSRKSITRKTKLALESGIGGIMIWELGQDMQPFSNHKSLMRAVAAALPKEGFAYVGKATPFPSKKPAAHAPAAPEKLVPMKDDDAESDDDTDDMGGEL